MIHDRVSEQQVQQYVAEHGMLNLREDGLRWLAAGETSLEEVLRVTRG